MGDSLVGDGGCLLLRYHAEVVVVIIYVCCNCCCEIVLLYHVIVEHFGRLMVVLEGYGVCFLRYT